MNPFFNGQETLSRSLRGYLRAVTNELGVGLEACTVDLDVPVSAYLALDRRLPEFPDRDLALLWDERHGWSAAIETHSGEDLIVVAYLGGDTVAPAPRVVGQFSHALLRGSRTVGRLDPPAIRPAGGHEALVAQLQRHIPAEADTSLELVWPVPAQTSSRPRSRLPITSATKG